MFSINRARSRNSAGFTLIELLVVIAIIGILASVVLASVTSARSKARDARRKQDIHQLQIALELYYSTYGYYPPEAGWCDSSIGVTTAYCGGTPGSTWAAGGIQDLQVRGFMAAMPVDPLNNTTYFYYYEPVHGQYQYSTTCGPASCAYILGTRLENSNDPQRFLGCLDPMPNIDYCVSGGAAILGSPYQ